MKKRCGILGIACAFALAPFSYIQSLSASAVSTTIITPSVFSGAVPSISGYYTNTSLGQSPITFTFNTVQTIVGSDIDSSNSNQNGRGVYMYTASVPADLYTDTFAPIIQLDIDWGLENVTYLDTGVLTWVGNSPSDEFFQYSLATLRPYNFTECYFGGQEIMYMDSLSSSPSLPGWFSISEPSVRYSGWQYIFESATPKQFNWGTAHISTSAITYGTIWVGIISPIVNDDYVIAGRVPPPNPGSSSYGASGQITGTVGTQTIDADFDITIQSPDYSSELEGIRSDLNPSYDSSTLDDMGAVIADYHLEESQLLVAADSALDSLPSLEFDSSMIDGAVNPLTSFFGINIVGIMVFWVGTIAFISYILFGKWA